MNAPEPAAAADERFPTRPSPGRYLWNWVEQYGLEGEGLAPTSMPGHHFITRAALAVLPDVAEWLGAEADLLTWTYCGLPDMNWARYGRFNDDIPEHVGVRYPDSRREWNISRYCGFNPVTKRGKYIPHAPPTTWQGFASRYALACREATRGRRWDAVRYFGAGLHYLQDSGSPPHVVDPGDVEAHRRAECPVDPSGIVIPGYRPKRRRDPAALARAVTRRCKPAAREVVSALQRDPASDVLERQTECARICAEATADALADFHRRFGESVRFEARPPRRNVELLGNGDFARASDEDWVPRGWVMKWWDRTDREVDIARRLERGVARVVAKGFGPRVACMTTWPRAVRVRPGEVYRLSGRVRVPAEGEAGLYAEVYDTSTRRLAEWRLPPDRRGRWSDMESKLAMPEGAAILRPGVFTEKAHAPARFARVGLVRT